MGDLAGRRLLALALLLLLVAALWVAPVPSHWAPGASPGTLPVSDTDLACPTPVAGIGSASAVSAVVAPAAATSSGSGTGALRALAPQQELAAIGAVDQPVSLLARKGPLVPVIGHAAGTWAPALVAGQAARVASGRARGLASAACLSPASSWWFTGAGSALGRRSLLELTNPAPEGARFDVELLGRDGPVAPVAGRGIEIAGNSAVELQLDALAPNEDLLAVHVIATSGRVSAALYDSAAEVGGNPRGSDYIGPAAGPAQQLVFAGIPAGSGRRILYLANPGDSYATARTTAMTTSGTGELPGLPTVAVPAHSVVSVDLSRNLRGHSATLRLDSDQPITGSLQATWGARTRESMWLAAGPLADPDSPLAGAAAVPGGKGLETVVTVAAPQGPVYGTLTVISQGSGEKSPFAPDDDLEGRAKEGWRAVAAEGAQPAVQRLRINVPAGTQRQLTLSGTGAAALLSLHWLGDPASAPAAISHVTLSTGLIEEPDNPLLPEVKPGQPGTGGGTSGSQGSSGPAGPVGPSGVVGSTDASAPGRGAAAPSVVARLPLAAAADDAVATGYQWWPTVTEVPAVTAVADPGVLAPDR